MAYKTPRGTRDFLPKEMEVRDFIINKIENWFKKYGYKKMETPAFEYLEVLTKKSGEVEDEIYSFEDKSGRKLGLRFDLTVPLARVIASNPSLKKPFKRYCISRVWRYERPQLGRFREFWQADADIVGLDSKDCEVELLDMATKICEDLGFKKYTIHLNNRKVLEGFAKIAGIEENKIDEAFRSLDKLDKIGYEGVKEEFIKRGLSENEYKKFIENVKISGENEEKLEYLSNLFKNYPANKEGVEDLKYILASLKRLGLEKNVLIDLTLVRGLDYYTGPIFEIKSKELEIGSFAGGGRYDDLIKLYGKQSIPAVGISFGLERIVEILRNKIKIEKQPQLSIVYTNQNFKIDAMKIADSLRSELPISIKVDLTGKSLTKQLQHANSENVEYVLIVGEDELKENKFKFKDMVKRTEEKKSLEEITNILKKTKYYF